MLHAVLYLATLQKIEGQTISYNSRRDFSMRSFFRNLTRNSVSF